MLVDLHCHTTASDGTLTPSELLELASKSGIDVIGLTDHDTVAGVAEATSSGERVGVRVVAGIELSARARGRSVHVLGYFIDIESRELRDAVDRMRDEREVRMRRMVDKLRELGYEITTDDVVAQARGAIVARPHLARALVAKGYVASVGGAFTPELIGDGGRAEVARVWPSAVEALELVGAAGGVAVLAHPGLLHHLGTHDPLPEAMIVELARGGLGGLEVDHPDHDPKMRDRLRSIARRLGLVCTGGSDFHGETERTLGTCLTGAEEFEELAARAGG